MIYLTRVVLPAFMVRLSDGTGSAPADRCNRRLEVGSLRAFVETPRQRPRRTRSCRSGVCQPTRQPGPDHASGSVDVPRHRRDERIREKPYSGTGGRWDSQRESAGRKNRHAEGRRERFASLSAAAIRCVLARDLATAWRECRGRPQSVCLAFRKPSCNAHGKALICKGSLVVKMQFKN